MNHTLRTFAFLPVLTTLAAAQDDSPATAAAGPAHKLSVEAKVGAKAPFRADYVQKQIIAAMNRETETKLVTDYDVEVLAAEKDGSLKVKLTWQRIQGSLSSPMGGAVEFDSAAKDPGSDDPMLGGVVEAFVGMVGKSVELKIGADGQVADRKPVTDLVASLAENVDGMGRMVMQGLLSDTAISAQAQVFGAYPKEAIAVGGSWKHSDKTGGRGGMKMKSDVAIKLAALDADTCCTTVSGTINIDKSKAANASVESDDDPQAAMMHSMMAEATIENGKVTGETVVERKDGMVRASSNSIAMDIAMPNPMGGDEPFIVKIEQTTKIARRGAAEKTAEKTEKAARPGK